MAVGESPGYYENERGRPFVGMSGNVLDAVGAATGIPRSLMYIANATRCTIDKDKDSVKDQNLALKCCRQYLVKAVEVVQPKIIIALGAFALRQTIGLKKIMENRGRFFDSAEFNCKVFCTVHPAYVLRGASREFWEKPAAQRTMKENLLFVDFEQVKLYLDTNSAPVLRSSGYRKGTPDDLRDLAESRLLAVDYETTGLDLVSPKTTCRSVSFTRQDGESFVFLSNKKSHKFVKGVNEILANPNIIKIVAARPFEEQVTSRCLGFNMRGRIHDVLEMAHLLDENYYRYNLESVADIYTPLKGIKELAMNMRHDIGSMPEATLVQYNGVDTDATFRAFRKMRRYMQQDKRLLRYYGQFMQKIQTMFASTVENGCLIDAKQLAKDEKALERLAGQLEQEAIDMIPEEIATMKKHEGKMRLSRDGLVRDYLFLHPAGLRWKPDENYITKKTKVPQCSEDHLNLQPDHPFTDRYIRARKARKILSTYHRNYWKAIRLDGRVYPTTLFNVTVTGRTVMKNPTIQTVTQRGEFAPYAKRCFVSDKGWLFGARDLGQSEIRIMGWLAKDKKILAALDAGIDIHVATAAMVNDMSIEEFMRLPRGDRKLKRQQAKGVNFGFLYGMFPRSFRIYARENYGVIFTPEECETLREAFLGGYAQVPQFHRKIERLVIKYGYVRSPLGRLRRLPDAQLPDTRENWKLRNNAFRQAINFPIQSFSSDLALIGMYLFWLAIKKNEDGLGDCVKPMWFIHDSVMFQAVRGKMRSTMILLEDCMNRRAKAYVKQKFNITIGYPITSDGKIGRSWQDLKTYCDVCKKIATDDCEDQGHV
jgi:uracil-DNA glycosylase family 4